MQSVKKPKQAKASVMSPETLASIKKQIRKFHRVYEKLSGYWNGPYKVFPHVVASSVLLQNASFDGSFNSDYSHENEVHTLYQILDLLTTMRDYHGNEDYMITYAHNELSDIINYAEMADICADEPKDLVGIL